MKWIFNADRPIYQQITQQIEFALLSGEYKTGERLPSVRDLAAQAGVNPNTMQRALQDLELSGYITTQRTAGRTITEDTQMIENLRQSVAYKQAKDFLEQMRQLGYKKSDIIDLLEKAAEEK
ncbi:MAG: GntR family transcriptional regulator [Oscillospiraceae bacterium]